MNASFFASALLMALLALSFATTPLIRKAVISSGGLAKTPLIVVLAAFVLAIGLYAAIGQPDIASTARPHQSSNTTLQAASAGEEAKAASVNELLAGLERRLEKDPGDAKGWLLLARSYDHLGRASDAADAYDKALALGVTDSGLEARLR